MTVNKPHYHRDQVEQDGFTIIRGILSAQEVEYYKDAAKEVVEYARSGQWPHVRTRGKQFPPWPTNFSPDIWGVSGLLHPDLGPMAQPFEQCYASSSLLNVASDILQTDDYTQLSMELFNMLINPLTDFDLDWHRDHIRPDATQEQESRLLLEENPYAGTQFNLALTDDSCLIVVPGSHKRLRTEEERMKTADAARRKEFITNQQVVCLHPGDAVFYNSNILHRASYSSKNVRLTLHGSYGHALFGKERARGVLQHGVSEWLPRFQPQDPRMVAMRARLEQTCKEFEGVDLGYSLDG